MALDGSVRRLTLAREGNGERMGERKHPAGIVGDIYGIVRKLRESGLERFRTDTASDGLCGIDDRLADRLVGCLALNALSALNIGAP